MNVRLKRARELAGYAVQLTRDEGLPTMLKRGAGFDMDLTARENIYLNGTVRGFSPK